jgi:putative ABC transport system permease protein
VSALPRLAARSLWNRRGSAALTVFAIAVSVALLVGVQKLRAGAQQSFASTVSGTDLIVGARSSPLGLLLYAIFRIGEPTSNVSWASYRKVAEHPDVAWTIPLALGDAVRGFRVIGTTGDYFEHYRYGRDRGLEFASGGPFGEDEAVLGADVARALGLKVGSEIVVSHGIGEGSFQHHDAHPVRVAGVLAATGTPVDRAVHVGLGTLAEMHGQVSPASHADHEEHAGQEGHADHEAGAAEPPGITAFLVGMQARETVLLMQRALNDYRGEALQAVMPGVALSELWRLLGVVDRVLLAVSLCVVLAGLLGMLSAILSTLNERRREMAILRSVGARPAHVFRLLVLEAGLLALAGALIGLALGYGALALAAPLLEQRLGVLIEVGTPGRIDAIIVGGVTLAALLMGAIPAWRAYRNSLADGLTVRL